MDMAENLTPLDASEVNEIPKTGDLAYNTFISLAAFMAVVVILMKLLSKSEE